MTERKQESKTKQTRVTSEEYNELCLTREGSINEIDSTLS